MQIWKNSPYIGKNVSPAAHAVFGMVVIGCGLGLYGIAPRDYESHGVLFEEKESPRHMSRAH